MKQILFGGRSTDLLHATATEYNLIQTSYINWTATIAMVDCPMPTAGTISGLKVKLDAAPGAGTSYVFTVMKNGEATDVTCAIADAATTAEDTAHSASFVAGDTVCLRCVPTGTPTARYVMWASVFEGSVANESILLARVYYYGTNVYYHSLGDNVRSTTEAYVRNVIPTPGAIKKLYVLSPAPGAGKSRTFTLRKNGSSQTVTCTVADAATTANDTANSVSVAAGDVVSLTTTPTGTPADVYLTWGLVFLADINGESVVLGANADLLDAAATEYVTLPGGNPWDATEANRLVLSKACTLKKFYGALDDTPGGAGKSYAFTVRQNAASPANGLTFSIATDATTGNDTAHEIAVADGDTLAIQSVPTGTPTARYLGWGLVCFIDPAYTTSLTLDALIRDTDSEALTLDAILADLRPRAPYYIEVRSPAGVLLGTIKDIITGSLEQETNMPDVLSLAIPLNEIRASLITRKNELWVRDSVTDTVLSICKLQIAEEVDG